MPQPIEVLPRPVLYDQVNEARSLYQRTRYQLLRDDFDRVQEEFTAETLGEVHASVLGVPDTTLNPLASQTRQLVVPGLYGRAPTRRAPPGGEALVGPQGAMAPYWPRMQQVQYYAVGTGVWHQRVSVIGSGDAARLVFRAVAPHDLVVWVSDEDPMDVVALWELRLRQWWERDERGSPRLHQTYAWDQWDRGDPREGRGRPPSYRVVECTVDGQPGRDLSTRFIEGGAREGASYWWRYPDTGEPFLPWLHHHAVDSGEFWPSWRRALHRGTLRSCIHWTFVARSALFATGEHTLLAGVDPDAFPGVSVHQGDGNLGLPAGVPPLHTMPVTPGTISVLPTREGQNIQAVTVRAGVHLPHLLEFANTYQMLMGVGDGLNPSDATRRSANPTSGAALEISAQSRREFSAQIMPLFHATDLRAIRMSAAMLALAGRPVPLGGYTLEYHTIPLTPTEQADAREQLQWEEDRGFLGPVEAYQAIHPGVDYDTAQAAVVAARVERARVDELVRQALEAEGLAPPPRPPAGPAPGEDEEVPEDTDTDTDTDEA